MRTAPVDIFLKIGIAINAAVIVLILVYYLL
jgi:hypothetical protein